MKTDESVYIEHVRYVITAIKGRRVELVRRPLITLASWRKRHRQHRWTRLVSANFLIDKKTKQSITNYEMLAIGISSKRIEKLHETLPLAEPE